MTVSENLGCLPIDFIILNVALGCINSVIAIIAFVQLIRIHMRSQQDGWTRQKVLHLMIGFSNLGYFIYFMSTIIATCSGWLCWSRTCGFILMASPKILFLAAFLLLLSFWVDLCHQANEEEEDDDENSIQQALLEGLKSQPHPESMGSHRKCFSFQCIHLGSRQKYVVMVIVLIFVLMVSFALLIWIGVGKNPINPSVVARAYEKFLAAMILLLSGALAYYGILLFLRLKKVRSEQASSEMWKVSSLAVVSVICFSTGALVALLTDIPLFYHWHLTIIYGVKALVYLTSYYFIGSSIPSAYLLWIIRELPSPITVHTQEQPRAFTFISRGASGVCQPRRWATATQSQESRASPI
ncbi:hypothetical protein L6164_031211 [Bauhinia variegata]|uniref:Uncharacterized protein n=1 Tax=Bauhinia variegata TaxID=167791 RepID=A0ACB9LEB0_BAUVA|nr:hypothetical protein L6164_031211 [Bauhinia variegata]